MLRQCVAAYVTNIALCGWEVVQASEDTEIDEGERSELQSFIDSANADESLTFLHSKIVEDYEKFGFAFIEVIRDKSRRVSVMRHAKSSLTQVCPKNPDPVLVQYDVLRGARTAYVRELKTFRLFVQVVGGKRTYFKEFGDPRRLDYETGVFDSKENPVSPDKEATELIHFRQNSEDAYGVPRWINQLPSILGSREAEEVNLRYFEDNTVPPMILSVAGGRLTGESFRELKQMLSSEGVGKDRQNRIMLIEAVPERESLDDKGSVQLRVDKLTDARPSDGLFKDYDESNQAKIRSSFRLPPVAVGLSQDVTFATANVSAFIAETQVYAPERKLFDEVYNKRFVNHPYGLNLKTVCLRSMAPSISNPETLIKSLTALNVMGAITPRKALEAANKILQIDMPPYPEKGEDGYEDWMDKPIQFSLKASGNTGIDPNGAGNTHDTQGQKDSELKAQEAEGDVSMASPENGSQ
jgi:PBSX family phage portal protein